MARLRIMERVDPGQLAFQPCVRSFVEAMESSPLNSVENWVECRCSRGSTTDNYLVFDVKQCFDSQALSDSRNIREGPITTDAPTRRLASLFL